MIDIYVAGPVDNTQDRSYYDIIADMVPKDVPITLFCPGRAFRVLNGSPNPRYIVEVNKKAMLFSDIVVFYITDVYTCGVWCEAMINAHEEVDAKKYVLYAAPGVRVGVYMKWIAELFETEWLDSHEALEKELHNVIYETRNEMLGVDND